MANKLSFKVMHHKDVAPLRSYVLCVVLGNTTAIAPRYASLTEALADVETYKAEYIPKGQKKVTITIEE